METVKIVFAMIGGLTCVVIALSCLKDLRDFVRNVRNIDGKITEEVFDAEDRIMKTCREEISAVNSMGNAFAAHMKDILRYDIRDNDFRRIKEIERITESIKRDSIEAIDCRLVELEHDNLEHREIFDRLAYLEKWAQRYELLHEDTNPGD